MRRPWLHFVERFRQVLVCGIGALLHDAMLEIHRHPPHIERRREVGGGLDVNRVERAHPLVAVQERFPPGRRLGSNRRPALQVSGVPARSA